MNESSVITLTPPAVEMVKRIRAKEGLPEGHALRVAVVGGGCSGFSYQLDFDDKTQDGDEIVEYEGVQVRVDPTSAQYQADIDQFRQGLMDLETPRERQGQEGRQL